MKVTYYVATSMDGFIAKKDGDVAWLDQLDIPQQDNGYEEFFSSVDALIMGRKTYELVEGFGTWPYGDTPAWVCSTQAITAMNGCNLQPQLPPQQALESAEEMGMEHLWVVGGGILAASLINKSLINHISIAHMPIVLGEGIPLFDGVEKPQQAKLQSSQVYTGGFTQLNYEIQTKEKRQ